LGWGAGRPLPDATQRFLKVAENLFEALTAYGPHQLPEPFQFFRRQAGGDLQRPAKEIFVDTRLAFLGQLTEHRIEQGLLLRAGIPQRFDQFRRER
jgi:hypothetical protein